MINVQEEVPKTGSHIHASSEILLSETSHPYSLPNLFPLSLLS